MPSGMRAQVGVERLLLGAVLGALAVGCASVEYRVPASEMVRLAQMSPDAAQHLTVELASQAQEVKPAPGAQAQLPKIEGHPTQ